MKRLSYSEALVFRGMEISELLKRKVNVLTNSKRLAVAVLLSLSDVLGERVSVFETNPWIYKYIKNFKGFILSSTACEADVLVYPPVKTKKTSITCEKCKCELAINLPPKYENKWGFERIKTYTYNQGIVRMELKGASFLYHIKDLRLSPYTPSRKEREIIKLLLAELEDREVVEVSTVVDIVSWKYKITRREARLLVGELAGKGILLLLNNKLMIDHILLKELIGEKR